MSLSLVRQAAVKGRSLPFHRHHTTLLKCSSALLSRYNSTSTATAAAAATPTDEQVYARKHIILPNPGMNTFKTTARVLPSNIAEQFAILKACIMSGSMERAARIMSELYKTKPEEMKLFADVNIFNTFLNGFVEAPNKPMTRECLAWFDSMKNYGVNADANTFAIIFKGFLK
jgi:DNA-directed RNA polymerase